MNIPLFAEADTVEVMAGAIRFTPAGLTISLAFVAHFLHSIRRHCWKQGLVIDFWHLVVGQGIVVPFFLMYPFASALPNLIAIGDSIYDAQEYFGEAFLINAIGYLALIWGGSGSRRRTTAWPRLDGGLYQRWADRISHCVLNTQLSVRLLELSCLLGLLLLVYSQISFGAVFGIRDKLFAEPSTRALFNLWYSLHVVAFSLAAIRYYRRRSPYIGLLLVFSFTSALVTGSRSMALLPVLDVALAYVVVFRNQLRWKLIIAAAGLLLGAMTLVTNLRSGERANTLQEADIGLPLVGLIYGNTFSDLRDFSWVLSAWDKRGDYLYGLGYASAVLSFVPRSISEFRERYALAIYTNELVGIDSTEHPGLRGGKFMEPFLNFGLVGVVVIGFVAGRFLGRTTDLARRQPADATGLARAYSAIIPYFIVSQFMNSAGFWVVYVYLSLFAATTSPASHRTAHA